jgi:uncharacterized protein with HEPN domain
LPSNKAPRRLQDITDNAQAIFRYTEGMEAFEKDRKTYDAVERRFERITEAAAKLGEMALQLMPDQPWQKVGALGNVLRHEYDAISEDRLFEIVKTDLPRLCAAAEEALRRLDLSKEP